MSGKEGLLPEALHLYTLSELTHYLGMFVKAQERAGVSTHVVLVTYNRVGEAKLPPRTVKGNLTLDVFSGDPLNHLSLPWAKFFMMKTRDELSLQISLLDDRTFFVVYGGEGEKFQLALDTVAELSSLAQALGKREKATFYLLTCGCGLVEKMEKSRPLYEAELLRYMVYDVAGSCGGFNELQAVADAVLGVIPNDTDLASMTSLTLH